MRFGSIRVRRPKANGHKSEISGRAVHKAPTIAAWTNESLVSVHCLGLAGHSHTRHFRRRFCNAWADEEWHTETATTS